MKTIGATWRDVQRHIAAVDAGVGPREGKTLVAHVLGVEEKALAIQESDPFPASRQGLLNELLAKRASGMPMQYVLGRAAFWKHDWQVTPAVLIPRPDTEILVREALARLGPMALLAEVGVGSGCVIGSILSERPRVTAVGTDLSPEALEVARANLAEIGVLPRCTLAETSLLTTVVGPFDMIVSNPPYIDEDEWRLLEPGVRDFEPQMALRAGVDGLDVYRPLIVQAAAKLWEGGWLCLEIGWQQAEEVTTLLQQQHGQPWYDIQVIQDLAGRDRVICARRR